MALRALGPRSAGSGAGHKGQEGPEAGRGRGLPGREEVASGGQDEEKEPMS